MNGILKYAELWLLLLLCSGVPLCNAHAQISTGNPAGDSSAWGTDVPDNSTAENVRSSQLAILGIQAASKVFVLSRSMGDSRRHHTATLLPDGRALLAGGISSNSLSTVEIYDAVNDQWTFTGPLNTARGSHTATLLPNGKVLVVGGQGLGGEYLSSAEIYDPMSGSWAETGSIITGRSGHTATLLLNGNVLVVGGFGTDGISSTTEVYDWVTGIWSTGGALNNGRAGHTATLLPNGSVLVAGGYGSSGKLSSAEIYDDVTGTWTQTGQFTFARSAHTATLLPNGKVLIVGGDGDSGALASAELYDPDAGNWTPTGALTTARSNHTATLLPTGKLLVIAGKSNTGEIANAELYNSANATWTSVPGLNNGRSEHTALVLPNGKLLAAGGQSGGAALSSVELTDLTSGGWATPGLLNQARYSHASAVLLDGRVLVAGGVNGSVLASAELYDPLTATWRITAPMIKARSGHMAVTLANGKVLVIGGSGTSAELFDPATETWALTGSTVSRRESATATLLPNGKVLVAGGYLFDNLATAELYDSETGFWTATGSMGTARAGHTATLLPNGNVLVAGTGPNAEIYDAATGIWAPAGTMAGTRINHTATLLSNGKVLVCGGQYYNGATWVRLSSAEICDPANGTWTQTGMLAEGRYFHTVTLLPTGKVLVAGGYAGTSTVLASAEVYDPTTGRWSAVGALTTARYHHTANLLPTGKVLFAGGYGGNTTIAQSELYDSVSGTWALPGLLAGARNQHTATVLPNGKTLVAGGYNGAPLASAELYDFTSATSTPTTALTTGRYNHVAVLLPNGKVLVLGGIGTGGTLSSAELYDSNTGTWTSVGSMTTDRASPTATLLPNGKVLVAGGWSGASSNRTYLSSAELYDCATGIWTSTGNLGTGRYNHSATLMANGKVLVAGGYNDNALSSSEVYDPALGTWSPSGQMAADRYQHTATLLFNGKVLVAGGYGTNTLSSAEIYDPSAGSWNTCGSLTVARYMHTAVVLSSGKVLVAGGYSSAALSSAEIFDPAVGVWTTAGLMTTARYAHTMSFLPNGKVWVAGGYSSNYLTSSEVFDLGLGFNASGRPQIASARSPLGLGCSLVVTGSGFRGASGGSGGDTADSPGDYPLIQVRALENGQSTFVPPENWSLTSFKSMPITWLPVGYALATIYVNGVPGPSQVVLLTEGTAAILVLSDLAQTYDGSAKRVMATPTPSGLVVDLTYNGLPGPPTNAGSYMVVGTINDPICHGSATNTLVISKAIASVNLGNLDQTYNGTAREVTVTTTPPGLSLDLTYNGLSSAPTNSGTYTVIGTIRDGNYAGRSTNALMVSKALADLALNNLMQTYDGTARSVIVSTMPLGLPVDLTYENSTYAPTNAGTYKVVATIHDANYLGSKTQTLVVSKAQLSVSLGNLAQIYNGKARIVTATTTPSGYAVDLTYNGLAYPPTNAGTYTVVGVINDPNHEGAGTNTLLVAKARAALTLGNLAQIFTGADRVVTVTTIPSGLTVNLTYDGITSAPTNAGSYTVIGTVQEANYMGSVTNTFLVKKAGAVPVLSNLAQTYDRTARIVTVTTTPSGLAVDLTYDDLASPPTNAGSYTVIGTINHPNYQGAVTNILFVNKASIMPVINDVIQNYDGIPKGVTVTTTPSDLRVNVTYDGLPDAPTQIGKYTVVAVVEDNNYEGGATNTLFIRIGMATVDLGDLAQTYDGTARSVTVTTVPAGLPVGLTYNGLTDAPTNAGRYTVIARITDVNYQGSAIKTLAVNKARITVSLANLTQTYDGLAKTVSATTTPSGLTVNLTYNGFSSAPTNPGTYIVIGTIDDLNYLGSATNALVLNCPPIKLASEWLINGTVWLSFTNAPGVVFTVLATTNLLLPPTDWKLLGAMTEGPAGYYQFFDSAPVGAKVEGRCYQVRQDP